MYLQILLRVADSLLLLSLPAPAFQRLLERIRIQPRLGGKGYQLLQAADIPLLLKIGAENPMAIGFFQLLFPGEIEALESQAGIWAGHHVGRQAHVQADLLAQRLQLLGIACPAFRVIVGIYLRLRRLGQLKGEVFNLNI